MTLWLTILRSRYTWYAAAVLLAAFLVWRWAMYEQEKGAARVQAVWAAKQAAQAQRTIESMSQRLNVSRVALARSRGESRRYEDAKQNDKDTVDWRARCGGALPASVRDYIGGAVQPTGGTGSADSAPDPPGDR